MSLDKWIKSDEKKESKKKSEKKKKEPIKEEAQPKTTRAKSKKKKKTIEPTSPKIIKHNLKCSKKGCNYQKTIVKKQLHEKDTICPRCKSVMKTK